MQNIERTMGEKSNTICPVCTLYLREGITLQSHLETHPKEQVIQALLKLSNEGQRASTSQTASTSSESSPVQTIANSHSSFVSSTPYVNPQTQMTTAVTYQHFMTSNGSAIMPQYIQVPTIINPNNNIPVISNQAMSFIPNPAVNYPQTMYNPMYNPYIPQPYPFTQPLYTNIPMSVNMPLGESCLQTNAQNEDSTAPEERNEEEANVTQPSVLVKKCTVATSTQSEKRNSKSEPKKSFLKYLGTRRKRRFFRSKLSETSSSLSVIKSPVKNSLSNASKVSAVSKKSVIRTVRPKISLETSNVDSNLNIISPPPLTLITGSTNTISDSKAPPPPPLSKAPCIVPQNSIKSEDVTECVRPRSTPAIIIGSTYKNEFDYYGESAKVNSVIVESNSHVRTVGRQSEIEPEMANGDEMKVGPSERVVGGVIMNKEYETTRDPLGTDESDDVKIPNASEFVEEYIGGGVEPEEEMEEPDEEEEEEENSEKQEKVFQMIEVFEESKIDVCEVAMHEGKAKEIVFDESEVNRDCSREHVRYEANNPESESFPFPEYVEVKTIEPESEKADKENENRNADGSYDYCEKDFFERSYETAARTNAMEGVLGLEEGELEVENVGKSNGSQAFGFVDVSDSTGDGAKVYRDLGMTPAINMTNFVEVDGIKIFFNNGANGVIACDPAINGQSREGIRNLTGYLKEEIPANNCQTVAESVIQLVSGANESKMEFPMDGGNYPPTTSQTECRQLDVPNFSPLALDIQADESMPARGELSEQESLGAENSTWNLFHGDQGNVAKSLEEWREFQQVSVIGSKSSGKKFKCSTCNEVFSCPKERRVHKNAVHVNRPTEKKPQGTPRKPKTYACTACSAVFSSIRDRKIHALQFHNGEAKNKSVLIGEIKQEIAEPEFIQTDKPDEATIKNEGEETVKTENSIPPSAAPAPVGPTQEVQRTRYCSHCRAPFTGLKKLRDHLRSVHGENPYTCETCSQNFEEESEFNDHLHIHPLTCDKCGKKFHKRANLNLHAKRHMDVKPFECTLCPKSFVTRQKLQEHMNGHTGKKPLKCTHCDKAFSRHSNLIQHRNLHHLNVKKKLKDFVCRCGEVFHSLRKLEWHKEVHEPKPKPCPFCSQKFIHSASVTRHIRRSHLPNYLPGENREFDNVQCPVCEKVYLRSSLAVHMRVHNGEKPFACKICNKRFSTKWNLELHNWTHQSRSNMPFKCSICKSAFFREPDFVAHLNAHRNYKPFTCNICGQKFIRKYSCLRHQEEHKKSKQFVCAVNGCAKSFHRGYYLRDHMKVHTGVRPHTCHICGKTSSTKSNHNKHIRIHDTREPVNTEN